MLFGVQIIGILFGLVMIYFTFLYYKRQDYDRNGLILWLVVWLSFLFLAAFPQTVYGVMETLAIHRTADVFFVGGFLVFSVIVFRVYHLTKKTQKRVEEVVRNVALMGKNGKRMHKI